MIFFAVGAAQGKPSACSSTCPATDLLAPLLRPDPQDSQCCRGQGPFAHTDAPRGSALRRAQSPLLRNAGALFLAHLPAESCGCLGAEVCSEESVHQGGAHAQQHRLPRCCVRSRHAQLHRGVVRTRCAHELSLICEPTRTRCGIFIAAPRPHHCKLVLSSN